MSDFNSPAAASASPAVPADQRPLCTPEDVAAGKALAIVSYVCNFFHLPFFVVPLIMRSDRLSLYHAKQCLILWLTVLVLSLPVALLAVAFSVVTLGIGACIVIPLGLLLWVAGIVVNIMGIVNAAAGVCAPIPLIGGLGERWFAGITVQPKPGASP